MCVEKLVPRDHHGEVCDVCEEDLDLQAVGSCLVYHWVLTDACTNPYEWSFTMASKTHAYLVFHSSVLMCQNSIDLMFE